MKKRKQKAMIEARFFMRVHVACSLCPSIPFPVGRHLRSHATQGQGKLATPEYFFPITLKQGRPKDLTDSIMGQDLNPGMKAKVKMPKVTRQNEKKDKEIGKTTWSNNDDASKQASIPKTSPK
jgi:hypothetical protein